MLQTKSSQAKKKIEQINFSFLENEDSFFNLAAYIEAYKVFLEELDQLIIDKAISIENQKEKLPDLLDINEKEGRKKQYWINKQESELTVIFNAYHHFIQYTDQIYFELKRLQGISKNQDKQLANAKYLLHQAFLEVESQETDQELLSNTVDFYLQMCIKLTSQVIRLKKQNANLKNTSHDIR